MFILQPDLIKHFLDCPDVIGDPGFHRGGNSEGLVKAAKIVVHIEEGYCVDLILDLLRESIGQPRESQHSHAHREVLTLNVTGGDLLRGGLPTDDLPLSPDTFRGTVPHILLS